MYSTQHKSAAKLHKIFDIRKDLHKKNAPECVFSTLAINLSAIRHYYHCSPGMSYVPMVAARARSNVKNFLIN